MLCLSLAPQHIDGPLVRQHVQRAVHRGQADPVPGRPQPGMQILGADEDARPGQLTPDRFLLDAHPDHPLRARVPGPVAAPAGQASAVEPAPGSG